MKKCPKCNAEIEENARFCLYCMTSFEEKQKILPICEKNKRWYVYLTAVLVFVIFIVLMIFALTKKPHKIPRDEASISSDAVSETESHSSENSAPFYTPSKNEQTDITDQSGNNNSPENTPTNNTETDDKSNGDTTTTTPTTPNDTVNQTNGSNNPPESDFTPDQDTDGNNENTPDSVTTTPSEPVKNDVVYTYRDAKYGDDFAVSTNFDNSVVITGVSIPSQSGEYNIPSEIDGKKVVAIMGLAFSGSDVKNTVKKVIVPATVKTIWNDAFAECYNMTDIYFCGNSIYTETKAFADSSKRTLPLTIHCSSQCSDRNFRYYKNSAANYGAEYEEWNG